MIRCAFEDGHAALLRHVVVDGLVVRDDQLLVIRRAESLIEGGKLALPGGYVDRDEQAADAMRRELLEETGYEALAVELFTVVSAPERGTADDRQNVALVMLVEAGAQVGAPDWEVTEVQWLALDDPRLDTLAFDHSRLVHLLRRHRNGEAVELLQ